jgi:hypothetical protein
MPVVPFNQLPDDARVWVFPSGRDLNTAERAALLTEVDGFLEQWKAHGAPLRSARELRDDRFLAIGVDPTLEQASGCSIDGLFRGLRALEQRFQTSLMAGSRVFYRDPGGAPRAVERQQVPALFADGTLTPDTRVFDTSVTDARAWRQRFEVPAAESWVARLGQASQASSRAATNSSSVRNG